jgi:hypothetical protein
MDQIEKLTEKMMSVYKIPYRCAVCGVCATHLILKNHKNESKGVLEIHFKNGNKSDLTHTNVQFLCPLCYSFADSWV